MEIKPANINSAIQIRISARAKHACLKVNAAGTVEVVIPRGFNPKRVPDFIAQNQAWLNKTVARLKAARDPLLDTLRPQKIFLRAVNETWRVNYGFNNKPGLNEFRNTHDHPQLWIWSAGAPEHVPLLLGKWLTGKAESTLQIWLDEVSWETGLNYEKLSIRAQKTRWGSCSHKKHINLNRALMFLPEELVRYLMIHELSHTMHLNHSRAFWSLVARWAPQYKQYEKQLNRYSSQIPLWALV